MAKDEEINYRLCIKVFGMSIGESKEAKTFRILANFAYSSVEQGAYHHGLLVGFGQAICKGDSEFIWNFCA